MRQSLKTRLLSAAYKAACAFAEKVFAFTESIREKQENSYLDDLFDHRDALAEELREGEELASTLSLRNARVQAELDRTERELHDGNTQAIRSTYSVADFDDLPAPQGMVEIDLDPIKYVDEDDAPWGYKAAVSSGGCTGCSFDPLGTCPSNDGGPVRCNAEFRGDGKEVVFHRR